jgi:hypothetical protein
LPKIPRAPGSLIEQLLVLAFAAGVISVPLVTVSLPQWARITVIAVVGTAIGYSFLTRWCPEIERPANLDQLASNPARTARGFRFLEKHLLIEVGARGGNRRPARISWRHVVANTGKELVPSIDMPLLTDVPVWEGDVVVAVSVDGSSTAHARLELRDHYSPTIHVPLPHRGLAPGDTVRVDVTYDSDAFARIDADTWVFNLASVAVGAPTTLSLTFPASLAEEATAYVIRRRAFCCRSHPLGSAEMLVEGGRRILTVRYERHRGDEYLIVDTALHPEATFPRTPATSQGPGTA